jgi:probable rRNA maturation factor
MKTMKAIQIEIDNECPAFPCPDENKIEQWIAATLDQKVDAASVAIKIIDEKAMQALNETFRQKAKPTNILSFPSQLPELLKGDFLGDLAICAPVVQQEASAQHKNLESHFAHLIVHGTLHLLGYDHIQEADALEMENEEIRILNQLGYPDPYFIEITHD